MPIGTSDIVRAEKNKLDNQRMIRNLNQQEQPPKHFNFTSRFCQKHSKNQERLVDNELFYRTLYDQTSKRTFSKIVVPYSIVEDFIRTMHGDTCNDTLDLLEC